MLSRRVLQKICCQEKFGHVIFTRKIGEVVYLASAVRTPLGKLQGQLSRFTASQLGALVLEAAIKQSAVPTEFIHRIYVGNVCGAISGKDVVEQAISLGGFKKFGNDCKTISQSSHCGLKALISAMENMEFNKSQAAIAIGMDSLSNAKDFLTKTQNGHNKGTQEIDNSFAIEPNPELIEVKIQERGKPLEFVTNDEINEGDLIADGAAGVLLANTKIVNELNLQPLARILDYKTNRQGNIAEVLSSMLTSSNKSAENLEMLEIVAAKAKKPLQIPNSLMTKINKSGFNIYVEESTAFIGLRLVTHLSHNLQPGSLGCAMVFGEDNAVSALLIEKLDCCVNKDVAPTLTLYTKDPCPLCDMLVQDLETNFPNQYNLEKVFIDMKENVRFLRLYRNDIPVLFLNGRFLCMHKLNHKMFEKKLRQVKNKERK